MEKPSLEDFIAALPECPDCGEKLHRFAYCPGRSRIRSAAMQDPTQTEKKGNTMSPVSSIELERSLQERSRASASKQTTVTKLPKGQRRVPKVGTDGQPVTTGEKVTTPVKKDKGATKAAKPKAEGSATSSNRLTNEWPDSKGRDCAVGDTVKAADGHVIKVIGRWSKHLKDGGLVPMVTGHVVSGGTKDKGARHNAVAAEATHVK